MCGMGMGTLPTPKRARITPRPLYTSMDVNAQITICVSDAAPTPKTLPASSVSVDTLEITTSATREVFSSITPRRICCP